MLKYFNNIPIYYNFIDLSVNNQIDNIINLVEFSQDKDWGDNNFFTSAFNYGDGINVLKAYKLTELKEQIDNHFKKYINKNVNYKIESWFTLIEKGYYSHVHDHMADYSGIYYYNTNGDDGDLFFTDESSKLNIKPERGKILIFPSTLKHGVEINKTNNKRISIAFNIKLHKKREVALPVF